MCMYLYNSCELNEINVLHPIKATFICFEKTCNFRSRKEASHFEYRLFRAYDWITRLIMVLYTRLLVNVAIIAIILVDRPATSGAAILSTKVGVSTTMRNTKTSGNTTVSTRTSTSTTTTKRSTTTSSATTKTTSMSTTTKEDVDVNDAKHTTTSTSTTPKTTSGSTTIRKKTTLTSTATRRTSSPITVKIGKTSTDGITTLLSSSLLVPVILIGVFAVDLLVAVSCMIRIRAQMRKNQNAGKKQPDATKAKMVVDPEKLKSTRSAPIPRSKSICRTQRAFKSADDRQRNEDAGSIYTVENCSRNTELSSSSLSLAQR